MFNYSAWIPEWDLVLCEENYPNQESPPEHIASICNSEFTV